MVKFVTIKPFYKNVETIVTDLTIQTIVICLTECRIHKLYIYLTIQTFYTDLNIYV